MAGTLRGAADGVQESEEGLQPHEGGEPGAVHEAAAGPHRPLLPLPVVPEEHGAERRQGEAGPERGGGLGAGRHRQERHHCHHGRRYERPTLHCVLLNQELIHTSKKWNSRHINTYPEILGSPSWFPVLPQFVFLIYKPLFYLYRP